MKFNEEEIIAAIIEEWESNEDLHEAETLKDVYAAFKHMENFCEENEFFLVFEVDEEDVEDLPVSFEDDELNEILFQIPIKDTSLNLEFSYIKDTDNKYLIHCDVDFSEYAEEYAEEYY